MAWERKKLNLDNLWKHWWGVRQLGKCDRSSWLGSCGWRKKKLAGASAGSWRRYPALASAMEGSHAPVAPKNCSLQTSTQAIHHSLPPQPFVSASHHATASLLTSLPRDLIKTVGLWHLLAPDWLSDLHLPPLGSPPSSLLRSQTAPSSSTLPPATKMANGQHLPIVVSRAAFGAVSIVSKTNTSSSPISCSYLGRIASSTLASRHGELRDPQSSTPFIFRHGDHHPPTSKKRQWGPE